MSEVARVLAGPISRVGAGFMSDPSLSATGARLGYTSNDFYFAGRAGVLGDVDAAVAAAALVFFAPDLVATAWDRSQSVQPRREAARAFVATASEWAERSYTDDVDWARISELAQRVVASASPAGAPLFAGWVGLDVPNEPKSSAQHGLNALREYRMAIHAAAVIAHALSVDDAVRHRSGHMLAMYGWPAQSPSDPQMIATKWAEAERSTNRVMGVTFEVLGNDTAEFVALCQRAAEIGIRPPGRTSTP